MTIISGGENASIWKLPLINVLAQLLFESQYTFLGTAWKHFYIVANCMLLTTFPSATTFPPNVESKAISIYYVWGKNKNETIKNELLSANG